MHHSRYCHLTCRSLERQGVIAFSCNPLVDFLTKEADFRRSHHSNHQGVLGFLSKDI